MDRVSLGVAGGTNEVQPDDDQTVDVFQVLPDSLFGVPTVDLSDNHVASGAAANLARHTARQGELGVRPLDIDL